jgi:hypothetical protein
VTSPATIISSALRREATPAAAMIFCNRSCAIFQPPSSLFDKNNNRADHHKDNHPIRLQTGLEQAPRMALSHSPAWLADLKKLERLKRLCMTQNERQAGALVSFLESQNEPRAFTPEHLERRHALDALADTSVRNFDLLR